LPGTAARYASLAILGGVVALVALIWLGDVATPLDGLVEKLVCKDVVNGLCLVHGLKAYRVTIERHVEANIHAKPSTAMLYFSVIANVISQKKISAEAIEIYCDKQKVASTHGKWKFPVKILVGIPVDKYLSSGGCNPTRLVIHLDSSIPVSYCSNDICLNSTTVVIHVKPPSLSITPPRVVNCSLLKCLYRTTISVDGAILVTPSPALEIRVNDIVAEIRNVKSDARLEGDYYIFEQGVYKLIFIDKSNATLKALRAGLRNGISLEICLFSTQCTRVNPLDLAKSITPWFFVGAYSTYEGELRVTGLYTTLLNVYPIMGIHPAKITLIVESIEGDKARVLMSIDTKLSTQFGEIPIYLENENLIDFIEGFKPIRAKVEGNRIANGKPCILYVSQENQTKDNNVKMTNILKVCVDKETRWPLSFELQVTIKSTLFYINGVARFKLVETNIDILKNKN